MRIKHLQSKQSGLALVMVLWTAALLTVLVTLAARNSLLDTKISQVEIERHRCRWAARAGLETAIALLQEDDPTSDSLFDLWADNPEQLEVIDIGGISVEVYVVDASSKLNLNTASRNQLLWIPDMTEEIADSILDWRDSNEQPRAGGAESGYYLNLDYGYPAKNSKFRTIGELRRVKDVTDTLIEGKGRDIISDENIGWKNYFTPMSMEFNRTAQGTEKININEASQAELMRNLSLDAEQAQFIMDNRPFTRWTDLLEAKSSSAQNALQVSDSRQTQPQASASTQNQNFTAGQSQAPIQSRSQDVSENQNKSQQSSQANVQPQVSRPLDLNTVLTMMDSASLTSNKYVGGRVNINTASIEVLTALLDGNRALAENIETFRQGSAEGFVSLRDFRQVDQMTDDILKSILDQVTVRSCVYEIYCRALSASTNLTYKIETMVNREAGNCIAMYWHEGVLN